MMDGIDSLKMYLFPLVSIYSDPHALLDVCGGDTICKVYHEFGKLLHIDDIPEICFISNISKNTCPYFGSSESALMILVHLAT